MSLDEDFFKRIDAVPPHPTTRGPDYNPQREFSGFRVGDIAWCNRVCSADPVRIDGFDWTGCALVSCPHGAYDEVHVIDLDRIEEL